LDDIRIEFVRQDIVDRTRVPSGRTAVHVPDSLAPISALHFTHGPPCERELPFGPIFRLDGFEQQQALGVCPLDEREDRAVNAVSCGQVFVTIERPGQQPQFLPPRILRVHPEHLR
jgi:hypothetical protein